jgi:hypothetical protein
MRWLLVLLSCAACNSLLGLDKTTELPGPDAPIDAPRYACTPLPTFTKQPVRVFPGLSDYTADFHGDTLETAWNTATSKIQEEVPGRGPFADAQIMDSAVGLTNESPRLAPSGDQLFVRTKIDASGQQSFRYFIRGNDDWASPMTLTFGTATVFVSTTDVMSTPSQGETQRRILLTQTIGGKQILEFFEEGSAAWKQVDMPYTPAMFGLSDFSDPYLSPDALAMVFVGVANSTPAVYITVRSNGDLFPTTPTLLFQPPVGTTVKSPFLNRDCSKLYFTGSDGVYYTTP